MNYYQRHIGDYAKDTGHLSLLEHGVYTVLLDWSYGTERELPEEQETVYRICRAASRAEKCAVDAVVNEFFPSRKNKRVCEELEYCETVSYERRLAALRKHHPDLDAKALQELCKSTANAPRKQSKCSATRARSSTPVLQQPFEGGGVQVGDEEVLKFGREWEGEMASGTPSMHPDWVKEALAKLAGRREWPNDWKRWLIACWRTDHPTYRQGGPGASKKNADFPAQKNGATSPAQALFLLDRELGEVSAEIQALDDLNQPVPARLKQRRNELQKKRGELKGANE